MRTGNRNEAKIISELRFIDLHLTGFLFLIVLVTFMPSVLFSEDNPAPNQSWVSSYTVNNFTSGIKVVKDVLGGIYVTGGTYGASFIGEDIIVIKYDSIGNKIWSETYNGEGNNEDNATDLLVDGSNCVYVTGRSVNSEKEYETALIKYSADGDRLWVSKYTKKGLFCEPVVMTTDSKGNICITGFEKDYNGSDGHLMFTAKFSKDGVLLWAVDSAFGLNDYEQPVSVKCDKDCNIYIAGYTGKPKSGFADFLIIKYDSSGAIKWSASYNGPRGGNDMLAAMDLDAEGNCYVTGYSRNESDVYDYVTRKYGPEGNLLWSNRFNIFNSASYTSCLKLDGSGNVVVSGNIWGGSGNYDDVATVKYDNNGNLLWSAVYKQSGSYEQASAIDIDSEDNIYLTVNSSGGSFSILSYDLSGKQNWLTSYNGNGKTGGLVLDNYGSLYVTGSSREKNGEVKIITAKYSSGNCRAGN